MSVSEGCPETSTEAATTSYGDIAFSSTNVAAVTAKTLCVPLPSSEKVTALPPEVRDTLNVPDAADTTK